MSNVDYLVKLADFFEKSAKKEKQFVYHIRPANFQGKYIFPLSQLKEELPALYKKEIKKYQGRESHPEVKIKILDCQWKDCVNLSTLNPIKIFQLEELLGLPGYKNGIDTKIFKFDIMDLQDLEFCLYDDDKSPKKDEAYKKVTVKSYKETQFVPSNTAKYFAECKEKKELPLIFGNVPHLLVKDKIPIELAEIISFKASIT